jgi:hypothetical protein
LSSSSPDSSSTMIDTVTTSSLTRDPVDHSLRMSDIFTCDKVFPVFFVWWILMRGVGWTTNRNNNTQEKQKMRSHWWWGGILNITSGRIRGPAGCHVNGQVALD